MNTNHWLFRPIMLWVSVGSFVISWVFTCNLLAAMSTTGFATVIAFGLATVLEPAKISFHALGVVNRDLFALMIGVVLTIMSIVGTIGWLTVQHAEKVALATQTSAGFTGLQSQITAIDDQINNLQSTAAGLPDNYHTRKQSLMEQANGLIAEKTRLTESLAGYAPTTGTASNALFVSLGRFFQAPAGFIELVINAIYGILLELVAVVSGVYVFRNSGVKYAVGTPIHAESTGNPSPQPQTTVADAKTTVSLSNDNEISKKKHLGAKYVDENREDDGVFNDNDCSDLYPILPGYVDGLFAKIGKDGRLNGRRSVAKNIGIAKSQADRCHNLLKQHKLINVSGNATFSQYKPEKIKEEIENIKNGGQNA